MCGILFSIYMYSPQSSESVTNDMAQNQSEPTNMHGMLCLSNYSLSLPHLVDQLQYKINQHNVLYFFINLLLILMYKNSYNNLLYMLFFLIVRAYSAIALPVQAIVCFVDYYMFYYLQMLSMPQLVEMLQFQINLHKVIFFSHEWLNNIN